MVYLVSRIKNEKSTLGFRLYDASKGIIKDCKLEGVKEMLSKGEYIHGLEMYKYEVREQEGRIYNLECSKKGWYIIDKQRKRKKIKNIKEVIIEVYNEGLERGRYKNEYIYVNGEVVEDRLARANGSKMQKVSLDSGSMCRSRLDRVKMIGGNTDIYEMYIDEDDKTIKIPIGVYKVLLKVKKEWTKIDKLVIPNTLKKIEFSDSLTIDKLEIESEIIEIGDKARCDVRVNKVIKSKCKRILGGDIGIGSIQNALDGGLVAIRSGECGDTKINVNKTGNFMVGREIAFKQCNLKEVYIKAKEVMFNWNSLKGCEKLATVKIKAERIREARGESEILEGCGVVDEVELAAEKLIEFDTGSQCIVRSMVAYISEKEYDGIKITSLSSESNLIDAKIDKLYLNKINKVKIEADLINEIYIDTDEEVTELVVKKLVSQLGNKSSVKIIINNKRYN